MTCTHRTEFGNTKVAAVVARMAIAKTAARATVVCLFSISLNLSLLSVVKAENVRLQNDVFNISSSKIVFPNIKLRQDDRTTFSSELSFQDYLIEKKTAQFKSVNLSATLSTIRPVPRGWYGSDHATISNFGLIRRDRTHVQLTKEFNDVKVSAGVSTEAAAISNQLSSFSAPYVKLSDFNKERKMAAIEIQKKMNDEHLILAATLGAVREYGAVAGCCSYNSSPFLNTNPSARFFSVAASYAPSSRVSFFGLASLAYTKPIDNEVSINNDGVGAPFITDISSAKLLTWSLGLSAKNFLQKGDKVGFVLAMPVKVISGSMGLYDPSLNGQISRVNLSQTGTEMNMELSYSAYIDKSSTFTAAGIYRRQPNNDADAKPSVGVSVRMVTQF